MKAERIRRPGFIDQAFPNAIDQHRFITEMLRMSQNNLVPKCYPQSAKSMPENTFYHVHSNTIMMNHALMYLYVISEAKKHPEMTALEIIFPYTQQHGNNQSTDIEN